MHIFNSHSAYDKICKPPRKTQNPIFGAGEICMVISMTLYEVMGEMNSWPDMRKEPQLGIPSVHYAKLRMSRA